MVNIEVLKSIIVEGQEMLTEISAVPRVGLLEANARYVLVGVRQAGKSYMLYLEAQRLIRKGRSPEEFVFVNFDDERLLNFGVEDFDTILKAYSSLYAGRPILLLDEIQNIKGWEHFARRLANQKYHVFITGSNAKMLSKDIATTLGARYIEKRVFPYSFREYLTARGVKVSAKWMYGSGRGEVERHLNDYFQWGGFPELKLFTNKRHWLNELYEKILLGDIIQRNGLRNETAMRLTLKRLAENIKTPTSLNRLAGMVKAAGTSITPTSVADYIRYCSDSCILFGIENYAAKFADRATVKKHYFVDNGLLHIFLTDSETALLENLCAVTLHRKSFDDSAYTPYFYNKEVEIDFYLPELRRGIQSSYSISDDATLEREVKALTTFHRLYGLDAAEIVTYSEEREIERDGLKIRVVPLAKWLLEML